MKTNLILTKCPICYSKNISLHKGNIRRMLDGKEIKIPSISYWNCAKCGETFFSSDAMNKMDDYLNKIKPQKRRSKVA